MKSIKEIIEQNQNELKELLKNGEYEFTDIYERPDIILWLKGEGLTSVEVNKLKLENDHILMFIEELDEWIDIEHCWGFSEQNIYEAIV